MDQDMAEQKESSVLFSLKELMSLEEDDAASLLAKLPRSYVETVSIAIAQLDTDRKSVV